MLEHIIICGLASAYITYVIVYSTIFKGIRYFISAKGYDEYIPIHCAYCMSFWVSLLVVQSNNFSTNFVEVLTNTTACGVISSIVNQWIKLNMFKS